MSSFDFAFYVFAFIDWGVLLSWYSFKGERGLGGLSCLIKGHMTPKNMFYDSLIKHLQALYHLLPVFL